MNRLVLSLLIFLSCGWLGITTAIGHTTTPCDSVPTAPRAPVVAQPSTNFFAPNVMPPSPEAASLNKFGDVPVGLYTGLPNITIPIYGINYKRLNVPISLNYHASGLKVEEVASWVGLGWSLNAGGMVSRTVMGLPDDRAAITTTMNGQNYQVGGYLNDQTPESFYQATDIKYGSRQIVDRQIYDEIVKEKQRDVQPDVYNYNLPNASGRFYIDRANRNVGVPVPTAPVQITPRYTSAGAFVGFDIKDEQGILYSFGDGLIEDSQTSGGDYSVTGWLLNKITSPTGEVATFTYQPYSHTVTQFKGCNRFLFAAGVPDDARISGQNPPVTQYDLVTVQTKGLYISTINFPEGKVVFEPSTANRQDLSTKSLSSVKVYDIANTLVKQVDLTFGYFVENGTWAPPIAAASTSYGAYFRLRLDQVQEKKGSVSLPPYQLTYNTGNLPNRLSFAKDYWGYYNGKENNTDYAPKLFVDLTTNSVSKKFFGTADLGANDTYSKIGVLQKITYPTGGSINLEYEANTTYTTNFNLRAGSVAESIYEFVEQDYYTNVQYDYTKSDWLRGVNNMTDLVGTLSLSSNKSFQLMGSTTEFKQIDNVRTYYPYVYFISTTNPTVSYSFLLKQPAIIQLPAGTYSVQIKLPVDIDQPFNLNGNGLQVTLREINPLANTTLKNKKIGGLRIKRLITTDANGANAYRKIFDYSIGTSSASSGRVQATPSLVYSINSAVKYNLFLTYTAAVQDKSFVNVTDSYYFTSNSTIPLVYTKGQSVAYGVVAVMTDEAGTHGKEVHKFTTYENYPDVTDNHIVNYPSTPAEEYDWKRGFELEANSYDGAQKILQSSLNAPRINAGTYLVGYQSACLTSSNNRFNRFSTDAEIDQFAPDGLCDQVLLKPYKIPTGWLTANETVERMYDQADASKYAETIKRFTFDNTIHYQLTAQTQSLSDGTGHELLTEYTYAGDYTISTTTDQNALGIKLLNDKHMLAVPIEQTQFRQTRATDGTVSNKRALASTLTMYYNDKAVPSKILKLATDVPLTTFNRASINTGGGLTYSSAYQDRILLESYDNFANLTQQRIVDGTPTAYLWSHNGTRLAAEIKNAQFNQVQNALGSDYFALVSGSKTDTEMISILDSKVRQNSQFTNSLVTSFTYKPLVGLLSRRDPAALTTYYEYDPLNRLQIVKDNKSQIVKEYTYNYRDPNASTGSGNDGNQPPSSTGTISDQLATLNQAYTYTLPSSLFADPENQNLTYSLNGLPAGLSYANNLISGTPTASGQSLVTLTATDPGGLSSSISFFLTVGSCLVADPYIVTGTYSSSTPISFNAVNRIETDAAQQVLVNPSASLTLKAGQSVRLKPGFTIKPGASFRAYTGPCN